MPFVMKGYPHRARAAKWKVIVGYSHLYLIEAISEGFFLHFLCNNSPIGLQFGEVDSVFVCCVLYCTGIVQV